MFEENKFSLKYLSNFFKKRAVIIAFNCLVILVGLGATIFGLVSLVSVSNATAFCQPSSGEESNINYKLGLISVDVEGAINKPGIYQFGYGERIAQAIEKAGGFDKEADYEYIEKKLNLAEKLSDTDKIYIPYKGELEESLEDKENINSTLISVNSASKETLEELPGIGEKRAEDIISNRPYQSLSDLVNDGILTETIFNEIKGQIVL